MSLPALWNEAVASERRPTLPNIRDIFGEELRRSPRPSSRHSNGSFSLAPLHSALRDEEEGTNAGSIGDHSMSPGSEAKDERRHSLHRESLLRRDWSPSCMSLPSPQFTSLRAPESPVLRSRKPSSYQGGGLVRRSSIASTPSHSLQYSDVYHRSKSYSFSGVSPSRQRPSARYTSIWDPPATLVPALDWDSYSRRYSTDSSHSSQSSDCGHSEHAPSPSPSNVLQFQPIQFARPFDQDQTGLTGQQRAVPPPAGEQMSPFGVLIADARVPSFPPANPQRLSMLRGPRTSSSHSSLSSDNETPTAENKKGFTASKYGCPYCSKRFNRPSSLKIHINTHTGEKPFQCPHPGCGRCFSVQSNMRRHTRIHTQRSNPQESSGEDVLDETSETVPSPSGSPKGQLQGATTHDMDVPTEKSATPGQTPPRSEHSQSSLRRSSSIYSRSGHNVSVSGSELPDETMSMENAPTSHTLSDRPRSRIRCDSSGSTSRPGKRSRRASLADD